MCQCVKCGGKTRVYETMRSSGKHSHALVEDDCTGRRRECLACGATFMTLEIPLDRVDSFDLQLRVTELETQLAKTRKVIVDLERMTRPVRRN